MNTIQVIGICGNKFHGKDTIADHLVKNYGFAKISFGDPIKNALQQIFHFSDEQLWGNKKEEKDQYWNITPRETMQYVGTECFRNCFGNMFPHIGDKIWIMSLQQQLEIMIKNGQTKIVIPDVRFPNEAELVRKLNGYMIRVVRPYLMNSDPHASESYINRICVDFEIVNNTLKHLYRDIDKIMS
jgi:hypothetical protein